MQGTALVGIALSVLAGMYLALFLASLALSVVIFTDKKAPTQFGMASGFGFIRVLVQRGELLRSRGHSYAAKSSLCNRASVLYNPRAISCLVVFDRVRLGNARSS